MSILQRYFAYFIHPSLAERGASDVLRAKMWLVATLLGLVVGAVMGTDHLIRGPRAQAVVLFGASAVAVGMLWVLRKTGRLELVGNVTTALLFCALGVAVFIRGGAGAPAQFASALIPFIAILTAGWRSGVLWSALLVMEFSVFGAMHAAGLVLPVRVPLASQRFSDITSAFVVTGVFMGLVFAYEWYRVQTSRAHQLAEQQRSRAEIQRADAERARERAVQQAQLMHSSRLAAVGRLAAGVGHEVNNPMAYIAGNIEHSLALLDEIDDIEELRSEVREALTDALQGASRVTRIVLDLGTFARETQEHVRPVRVVDVVNEAVKMAGHQIRHRAELVMSCTDERAVAADGTRLTQLFLNLLINAAQAIPLGDAAKHVVSVTVGSDDDDVVVVVHDSGEGIPQHLLHRVTDPFFTTKDVGEGTGLGLSVCVNIAEQYGGTLTIDSTEGVGTTVTTRLPAHADSPRAPMPSGVSPREHKRAHVLVVDDDPMVSRTIQRTLNQHGHETDVAASGRVALERIAACNYDAILCDVMMPDLTGVAVYQALEDSGAPSIDRFIFMTGGVFSERLRSELDALSVPMLRKPWTSTELSDAVLSMISRRASSPSARAVAGIDAV